MHMQILNMEELYTGYIYFDRTLNPSETIHFSEGFDFNNAILKSTGLGSLRFQNSKRSITTSFSKLFI